MRKHLTLNIVSFLGFLKIKKKTAWAKAEEKMFGDDPEKLNWARNGRL